MIDAILGIVDFLISVYQLISNTLQSLCWVVASIPVFLGSVTSTFAYCPTPLLIWLEVCLALTVLFAVIKLLK